MIHGIDTAKNNGIIEKYCYHDSIENCNKFGGLYQWNEAMQYITTTGSQGICLIGWHIPTITELVEFDYNVKGDGNAIKEVGQGSGYSIRCIKDATTDINDHSNSTIPKSIDLLQNYPNPFNPSTTISFTIPERTRLVLSVYNELGQKVGVLEPLERGNGSI